MPPSRIYKGTTLVYERPDSAPLTAMLPGLATGTRIQLFRAANVRTDAVIATNTLTGVNLSGTRGTIRGGPKTGVANSIWYDINFDTGHDGWCVSDNYVKIASTTVQTTPSTFRVGDKIRLFRTSNIRSSAAIGTNLKGTNPANTTGAITAGPTLNGTINWYNINFDTGFDGWCASDNFVVVTATGGGGTTPWITGSCAPAVPSNGKIINVASGGSIKNAVNAANPGDTIVVANGTYNQSLFLGAGNSGTANGWITLKSATKYGAKINGKITLLKCDYFRIEGFDFIGSSGKKSGIGANASHHNQFINNRVYMGHIFAGVSDFTLIEGNVVHASVEDFNQIEVLYPQNITGDTTTKNRIIVRNNVSYDNNRPLRTDGSGIMIDCFSLKRPGDLQRTYLMNNLRAPVKPYIWGALVDNNICYDNAGAGIYVNYADHITVTNNFCYNNWQTTNPDRIGSTWAGEIANISSHNNLFKDNVLVILGTKKTYVIACQAFKDRASENNTWTGNITYNKSKPGDASLSVTNTCPVPAATNELGKGSAYASKAPVFLKETCS